MSMSTAAAENTAIHFLDPAKSGRNATAHSLDDDKSLIGLTGGEIFHEMMLRHDVKVVFGYPGGAILPVYDAIYNSEYFDFVLPRHEQGAGHMAEGYLSFVNKSHHEYI
jgi:acetolactate synthase-1/2/3 large subunit